MIPAPSSAAFVPPALILFSTSTPPLPLCLCLISEVSGRPAGSRHESLNPRSEGDMALSEPIASAGKAARRVAAKPWDQQRGENGLWYARFLRYVALGPTRSISLLTKGRRNAYPVPAHWPVQAKQLNWRERAQAFDEAARKDPSLITLFHSTAESFALNGMSGATPAERKMMEGLRYIPPEDDGGELLDPTDTN